MKQLIVAITLFSAALWAQPGQMSSVSHTPAPGIGPDYSQLYCSGFVTRKAVPRTRYVLGSKESPYEDRLPGHSVLFLRGPGIVPGQRYTLLRQIADPNREESAPEQSKKFAQLGALYQDIGWVTVTSIEQGTAIANFDFSCDTAIPGDLVVPFEERPQIAYRTVEPEIAAFRLNNSEPKGHILGAKGFISQFGTGHIVYTDFGSAKGAKPGDYLFVQRGYSPEDLDRVDAASEKLPIGADDTAVNPVKITHNQDRLMPNRVLGELLLLQVNRDSSTAMVTRSFSEMALGDVVQRESSQSAPSPDPSEASTCHPSRLKRLETLVHLSHNCADTN